MLKYLTLLLLTLILSAKNSSCEENIADEGYCGTSSDIDACDKVNEIKVDAAKCVDLDWQSMVVKGDFDSYAVIVSKGRLGNHLIAFTLIGALAKELGLKPFITEETYKYT